MKKATRQELLELLEYVRGCHSFCEYPVKCPTCGKGHEHCPESGDNRCEGCLTYDRISEICEQEGLA